MIENVIDTHVHVWDFDHADYPWLKGDTTLLNRTHALEELEDDRIKAGVTGGVLVQAANNREDTDWMLRVAAGSEWITGVVGWLPLQDPVATGMILEQEYTAGSYLKGVRHLIHNEKDPAWLLQASVLESLGLLAARDVPYDVVGVIPAHLRTALRVAEKWPGLRLVLDHLNQPPIGRPGEEREWKELMTEAAGHENIYVKISGLGTAAGKGFDWRPEDLKSCIGFVLQHFGAGRIFCGGDWPVCLLAGSYEKTWSAYRAVLYQCLGKADLDKVFRSNAQRFYKLP
jgi:L-fuconolactonase